MPTFFADGAQWMQGEFRDGNGNRCLFDALHHLRRKHGRLISFAFGLFLIYEIGFADGGLFTDAPNWQPR